MDHHHSLPAPPNYGTLDVRRTSCYESEYRRSIKTDSPVLGLMWLMFAMCFAPAALLEDPTIGRLGFAYSMTVSSALFYLQWARSRAWKVYSIACFTSSIIGLFSGMHIQKIYPMFADRTVNFGAVKICLIVLPSLLACVPLLGRALHRCDCGIVGSSAEFAGRLGWGWEPKAVPHMYFGFMCHSSAETDSHGEFPERVQHDLVHHRAYWSGEPALDYFFYIANEHLYLSCLFSHPGHPFIKWERALIMLLNTLLAVFPVAAFDVMFGPTLVKLICTTLVVTAPRNGIKALLRNIVVADSEIRMRANHRNFDCKFQRLVHKHRLQLSGRGSWNCWKPTKELESNKEPTKEPTKELESRTRLLELHHLVTRVRSENAWWHEVSFFSCLAVGIGGICYGCFRFISLHTDHPRLTLLLNCDGILYGFVLELVIEMLFTIRKSAGRHEGRVFGGFFHRWWHEREEYGSLYRPLFDKA